eukprot:8926256-Heterocapsa_arctica.AAC.1
MRASLHPAMSSLGTRTFLTLHRQQASVLTWILPHEGWGWFASSRLMKLAGSPVIWNPRPV